MKQQSMKETAANPAASAISGKGKTKTTVEEKVEEAIAHDPIQKEMAAKMKQERIRQVELEIQEADHVMNHPGHDHMAIKRWKKDLTGINENDYQLAKGLSLLSRLV